MYQGMYDKDYRILVIICTRNREQSMTRLLQSIEKNNYSNLKIMIIDSTFPEERYQQFSFRNFLPNENAIVRYKTTKGLPGARNEAIEKIEDEEVVVFFDDDITIPFNFFSEINLYLANNSGTFGIGVRIKNQYSGIKNPIQKISSNLKKRHYGTITRSGRNYWVPDEDFGVLNVDWIPGCCMVFRAEIFDLLRFDETLELGPTNGYALGEDVDFTFRCSRRYKLESISHITIEHHFESSSRDNSQVIAKARGQFLAHLKNSHPEYFSTYRIFGVQFSEYLYTTEWYKALRMMTKFSLNYFLISSKSTLVRVRINKRER